MSKPSFVILVVLASALALALSLALAANKPDGKIRIFIPDAAKKPPVPFDHAAHLARAGGDCKTCHHADVPGQGGKCTACHEAEGQAGVLKARTAFHDFCHKCHAKNHKGPRYPRDCVICHAK